MLTVLSVFLYLLALCTNIWISFIKFSTVLNFSCFEKNFEIHHFHLFYHFLRYETNFSKVLLHANILFHCFTLKSSSDEIKNIYLYWIRSRCSLLSIFVDLLDYTSFPFAIPLFFMIFCLFSADLASQQYWHRLVLGSIPLVCKHLYVVLLFQVLFLCILAKKN